MYAAKEVQGQVENRVICQSQNNILKVQVIQIRKPLNILLRKEVVYNKDSNLKKNPCLNITFLPY